MLHDVLHGSLGVSSVTAIEKTLLCNICIHVKLMMSHALPT